MGKRLYVVSEVEEYGENEHFNWAFNEFANLLDALGCTPHIYGEDGDYSRFDVQLDEYEQAMKYMEKVVKGELLDHTCVCLDEVEEALKKLGDEGFTKKYILEAMESFHEERDKRKSYMVFQAL